MGSLATDLLRAAQSHVEPWLLSASLSLLLVAVGYNLWGSCQRRLLHLKLNAANSQLSHLRSVDPLTGLATRAEFELQLETETLAADRSSASLSLIYIGVDNFRAINEAFGLPLGDGVLAQLGKRLAAFKPAQMRAARAAGDEFVLMVRGGLDAAEAAASELRQALSLPCSVDNLSLQVGVSMGIAVYPDDGARPRLIPHAALAMRSVKLGGGGSHARFHSAMMVNLRDQAELLQDLRSAVVLNQLQLYYQPKIDARTLQITAAEALLRWQHPRRGMISPTVFIPLAERHGLISAIGLWVIEEACRQAAQWRRAELRMRIAVNISGHQLRHDELVDQIEASLQRHQIPPERMTCEITESVAMEDTAATRRAFERLGRAGLHVSIDDFGTGHSCLASLRRLPAAELKIDRAFVADLGLSDKAGHIVEAVVQLGHSLKLRVVAEGVETEAQRDELIRLGCDELQGYLFAKPMTATALALWAEGEDRVHSGDFSPSLFQPTAAMPLEI